MGWYNSSWSTRRAFTVNNASNSNTLTGYAVPIALTSANFDWGIVKNDGSDIRVTASDGVTLLPYWVQNGPINGYNAWTYGSSIGTIWVKVPSITGSSSTAATVYVYYGNVSPATFTVPPIGHWVKQGEIINQQSSNIATLPENMVYDSVTGKYWIVIETDPTVSGNCSVYLASASTLPGPWTLNGSATITNANWTGSGLLPDGPCLVTDGTNWYIFASTGTAYGSIALSYWKSTTGINGTYSGPTATGIAATGITGNAYWMQGRVGEPYIFQLANNHIGTYSWATAGTWVMLFTGDAGTSNASEIAQIGLAYASSLTGTWTIVGSTSSTKSVLQPLLTSSVSGAFNYAGTSGILGGGDPYAYEIGGTIYIFCNAGQSGSATDPSMIEWTSTTDFATFSPPNTLFSRGNDSAADSGGAFRGAITLVGTTYYLPYCGYVSAFNTYQAFIATMSSQNTAQGYPPDQVFGFFENFANVTNAHLWTTQNGTGSAGTATATGNVLTLTSGTAEQLYLYGVPQFGPGYIVEAYTEHPDAGSANYTSYIGWGGFPPDNRFMITGDDLSAVVDWQYVVVNTSATGPSNLSQAISTTYHNHAIFWKGTAAVDFEKLDGSYGSYTLDTEVTTNVPTGTCMPVLSAVANTASYNDTLYCEYLLVRPYSSPEPTGALGAAQTQGMPYQPWLQMAPILAQ